MPHYLFLYFFFFNDTATTEIYTLSLHDALPISDRVAGGLRRDGVLPVAGVLRLLLYAPRDDVGARATARRGAGSSPGDTALVPAPRRRRVMTVRRADRKSVV